MSLTKLSSLINDSQKAVVDEPRNYIGASAIGYECLRKIWYELKGENSSSVLPKTIRTWAIGKRLEGLVLEWLEESGLTIERNYQDLESKTAPVFRGHVDAILVNKNGSQSIIEIKTAKDASFKVFVNKGIKVWNKQYYAQLQAYMGMSGIASAYLLALNKDNSDLHDEFVTFDHEFYKQLEEKALMISTCQIAPPRISNSPIWYQCKLCKYNKECHQDFNS